MRHHKLPTAPLTFFRRTSRRPRRQVMPVEQMAMQLEPRILLAATLTLDLNQTSVSEGAGVGAIAAVLTRVDAADLSVPLSVSISVNDTDELSFPSIVTIPANQSSTTFSIDTINDHLVDGAAFVTFSAAAVNFLPGSDSVSVTDDDTASTRRIGGQLSGSLPKGTYSVSHSIIVPSARTLTLAPATQLRFQTGQSVDVYGTLSAQANTLNPIIFGSNAASPGPGNWTGIRFFNNSLQSGSFLESVTVQHATIGVFVSSDRPTLTISASDIGNNSQHGIHILDDATTIGVVITTSRIHDNAVHGIVLSASASGCNSAGTSITLHGNEIDHNGSSGIEMGASASSGCLIGPGGAYLSSTITNNRIHDNLNGVNVTVYDSDNRGASVAATFQNNFIYDNIVFGMKFGYGNYGGSIAPVIVNNTIVRNGGAGIFHSAVVSPAIRIFNNAISGNLQGIATDPSHVSIAGTVGFNAVGGNLGGNFVNYPSAFGSMTTTNINGTPADVFSNISVSPCFQSDNLHIQLGCPLVGAGTATSASVPVPSTDFDGDLRDVPPDIGADEVQKLILTLGPQGARNDTTTVLPGVFQVREGAPSGSVVATVARNNVDLSTSQVVSILNPSASNISMVSVVTIPAGASSTTFVVNSVNDSRIESDVDVAITVSSPSTKNDRADIRVVDDDRKAPVAAATTEHRINQQNPENTQTNADVAWLSDTQYVTTWLSRPASGNARIVAQIFSVNDQPVGSEITVAALPSGNAFQVPRIDADPDGNFVVAWTRVTLSSSNPALYEVVSRRFSAAGTALTAELVAPTVPDSDTRQLTDVAIAPNGSWVVIYRDTGLHVQRYSATGAIAGTSTLLADWNLAPYWGKADFAENGDLVVVWSQIGGSSWLRGIYLTRYSAADNEWTPVLRVSDKTDDAGAAVSLASDGSCIVAWSRIVNNIPTLWVRRIRANGLPLTEEYQASGTTLTSGAILSVVSSANGDFSVAIESKTGDILLRQFHANGLPKGQDQVISTFANTQSAPGISLSPDGIHFLVTWHGNGPGDTNGIFARRLRYVNEAPTAIALANATLTIAENTDTSTRIKLGDVVVIDDDLGTNYLSLSGSDAAFFEIINSVLYLKAGTSLDYEEKSTYSAVIRANDLSVGGTPDASSTFTLNVANRNESPTGISLDNPFITENLPAGTTVGAFSTSDPDSLNTFTYALVSGSSSFLIQGNSLKTRTVLDHESLANASIRVRSTDQGGLFVEKVFSISIGDAPDGTAGSDRFVLTYTGIAPTGTVTVEIAAAGGPLIKFGTLSLSLPLTLNGLGGSDSVTVNGTASDDLVTVTGAKLVVNGGVLNLQSVESVGLNGGSGNDTYRLDGDLTSAPISINESSGSVDKLDFSLTTKSGIVVNLGATSQQTVNSNLKLTLSSATAIEGLIGGFGNDTLIGNVRNNTLDGHTGNDVLQGGLGNDIYSFRSAASAESDSVIEVAAAGTDTIDFSSVATSVRLNLGSNAVQQAHTNRSLKLNSGSTIENVIGGSADDSLIGNSLPNRITGNAGNDTLNGSGGSDLLTGGTGNDTYFVGGATANESDSLIERSGEGTDTLDFSMQTTAVVLNLSSISIQTVHSNRDLKLNSAITFENVTGGSGNDTITGNSLNNLLKGGGGHDILIGLSGNDHLQGGAGRDLLIGGHGLDRLDGGDDEDILIAGRTAVDTAATEAMKLRAVWMTPATYTYRVKTLRAGTGSPAVSLKARVTVLNDAGENDLLTGGAGVDWYLRALDDVLTDLSSGESVDLL